jgi:hypothetical protein
MRRNWLLWVAAALLLVALFKNPTGSAHFVNQVVHALVTFLSGIGL